ncbi:MAG: histidine--tRNA ligase [Bacteroidota bacterium]
MALQKPTLPKGTRDFSPIEMSRRNYIFTMIRSVFEKYGYAPIETPAMENLSTLMGKYGEEGDKLLFKILNSGDYLSDFDENQREMIESIYKEKYDLLQLYSSWDSKELDINKDVLRSSFRKIIYKQLKIEGLIEELNGKLKVSYDKTLFYTRTTQIIDEFLKEKVIKPIVGVEKGLRYDLTVPFARFVVMHQSELTFPFKRYQIQPVWRADRPQKGRYREFYQCDADIIGSKSLINEAELVGIIHDVFDSLNIKVVIKLNNRKILSAIAKLIGAPEKIIDITVAIDKLDKIGLANVNKELLEKGLTTDQVDKIQPIILLKGSNQEKIKVLKSLFFDVEIGKLGVSEIETVFSYVELMKIDCDIELDLTLARGLNYYTGAIFEVKAKDVPMGSISGGGRYDDLTGIFGLKDMSGVGISFGADRIYDVLQDLNLFPSKLLSLTKVFFCNLGALEESYAIPYLIQLRKEGVNCEIYPESTKLKKQFSYANDKHIPFVVIGGTDEMNDGMFVVKNMESGEQEKVSKEGLNNMLKSLINH